MRSAPITAAVGPIPSRPYRPVSTSWPSGEIATMDAMPVSGK